MSLLNSIVSAVGGAGGQGSLIPALIEQVNRFPGGLSGLIEKLRQGGLSEVVASWISTGANLPVSSDQLQSALGGEFVSSLVKQTGLDANSVLGGLAKVLPGLIDKATPDGAVAQGQELDAAGLLSSLSGLLGRS